MIARNLLDVVKRLRGWLCVLGLSPWLLACASEPSVPTPPVILPISLKESGEIVNTKIQVVDHHIYYFSLRFSFRENDQADRSRVRLLTGGYETDKSGRPMSPGIPTPVSLSVFRIESDREVMTFSREIDPSLTSWGGDNFRKQIGFCELTPGLYGVRLTLRRATPAFDGTSVAFSIGYDKFKTTFDPKK
jgi:hypothetical protein